MAKQAATEIMRRRLEEKEKRERFKNKLFLVLFAIVMIAGIIGTMLLWIATIKTGEAIEELPTVEEVPNVYLDGGNGPEYNVMTIKNDTLEYQMGNDVMEQKGVVFTRYATPDEYYAGLDYNSMQPYMSYKKVTNQNSSSYQICHSENAYTDENGYRRYKVEEDAFKIDGQDDYVIALGNFYKEEGVCGERYLIVTDTGCYTAITGDEKADCDTDEKQMFHVHSGNKVSLVEWIVDPSTLEDTVRKMGSVKYSENETISGNIVYIYKIS